MRPASVAVAMLAFAAVALALASAPVAAQEDRDDLSVGISERDSTITIEVTRDGEPLTDANVTVRSVGNETALDGDYTTDAAGEVVFGPEDTRDLSGVVHLRISVDGPRVSTAQLATITRNPDVEESAPLGQRISMELQDSVGRTRGAVEGAIFVTDLESVDGEVGKIDLLRSHAEQTIDRIEELQLEERALGRRHATGTMDSAAYYTQLVAAAGGRARLRADLGTSLDRLAQFDDSALTDAGVDVDSLRRLRERLASGREIQSRTSISSGR